ncbi:Cyclic nucleotide-gated ion channel 1 [Morella rubra]|uniref:Cyclic nucleotide-gated ion channel 1 n=1 Tax=Morella rubra TaxID=262757 RepID=A0A6A1UKH5_9ROSI|nr:Cyclic nucleotide-gated ion channel 1 [Morella rubra]
MLEQNRELLQLIYNCLEPVYYNKHSCISREGEPVDAVLFIMQGIVWKSTTNECKEKTAQFIGKGDFCGEELLDWGLRGSSPPSLSDLPISTVTVETRTKVYAFALMANDLRTIISRRQEAASTLQAAWRGTIMKRRMFQLQVG